MSKTTKNNKRLRNITEHVECCTYCLRVDRVDQSGRYPGQCFRLDRMVALALGHQCTRTAIEEAKLRGQTLRMLNPPGRDRIEPEPREGSTW